MRPVVGNLVPLTYPPVLLTRSDDHVHVIVSDSSREYDPGTRYDLTPEQARTLAGVLLALADGLPLSAIPGQAAG